MSTLIEAARQAIKDLDDASNMAYSEFSIENLYGETIAALHHAIEHAKKQKPWVWHHAPIKTQWGHDMVVADLAIDNDHTVSVYCERDQIKNVEAMFAPQPQREWVGLTDESVVSAAARVLSDRVAVSCNVDREDHWKMYGNLCIEDAQAALEAADAKLREKNGGNT